MFSGTGAAVQFQFRWRHLRLLATRSGRATSGQMTILVHRWPQVSFSGLLPVPYFEIVGIILGGERWWEIIYYIT